MKKIHLRNVFAGNFYATTILNMLRNLHPGTVFNMCSVKVPYLLIQFSSVWKLLYYNQIDEVMYDFKSILNANCPQYYEKECGD